MDMIRRYYFIFIIPTTVFVMSFWFRIASGPFWQYADPCYFYLFNALYIVRGQSPVNVWHPGTPLQVLIFIIIWIFNLGHCSSDAITHVLKNPEFYLYATYVLIVFSAFLSSIFLAIYVYRKTNDKIAAFLVQLPGLCFLTWPSINAPYPVLPIVANVSPESMFIGVMNLFNLLFLKLYFGKHSYKELNKVYLLAFIGGLGLAIKIGCFLPSIFSALIVLSWRKKMLFILVCGISFVFWTLPILSKYPQLWFQIKQAVLYSSRYGWGSATVIDWQSYSKYFNYMIHDYWFFIFSALGLLIWSVIHFIKNREDREARFLAAVSAGSVLQFIIIAKYYSVHYLVPGIALFSSIFLLFYLKLKAIHQNLKVFAITFIFIFIFKCLLLTISYYHQLSNLTYDIRDIKSRIHANHPDCTILPTWTGDVNIYLSQEHALFMGNAISFHKETDNLSYLYPHFYYFFSEEITSDTVSYGIWNFKKRIYADELLNSCPCSVFLKYGSDFSGYPYQTHLIDHSKYLSAFLLTGSTEKEANELFLEAQKRYNNYDYKTAFLFAWKSRDLNYEPRKEIEYFLAAVYSQLHEK